MTDSLPPFEDPAADTKRQRAKERLYVMCQSVGWCAFLAMQLLFSFLFQTDPEKPVTLQDVCNVTTISLIGWIISHYARHYVERWRLKELGWKRVLPRAAFLAIGQSLVWSIVGFGWINGILGEPYPDKINPFVLMLLSVTNGVIVYLCWYSVYFVYHVFDRFNRSEIERLRLAAVVKDAELRALKSQINPHFMFNSLNSVRALIDEDPARAREAVTQLANMLRYSLQSGSKQTVSFEDELTVVNDYLALEQVRHEERLRLRLDVAPETLRRSIPPMMLQTLVENAVKYGISTRARGGEIAIVARLQDNDLHIAVKNPGTLNAPVTGPARAASTGVGLRNAANRLQLIFGDTATLRLHQSAPDEVTAEVIVPQAPDSDHATSTRGGPRAHALKPTTA